MDIEKLDEDEFQAFRQMYNTIAEHAREQLNAGKDDINCPEIQIAKLYFPADNDRERQIEDAITSQGV